jgi:hypothetical protein
VNKEDIIRMAQEVGLCDWETFAYGNQIEWFANLVAAAEREECAKLCDDLADDAAKEQDFHAIFACESCGSAIRERGQV